jgi:hypothetical protein
MLNRDRLRLLTLIGLVPLISSCAAPAPTPVPPNPPVPPTPPVGPPVSATVLTYIRSIIAGLSSALPIIQAYVPAELYAKIIQWVAEARQLADGLAAATGATSTSEMIRKFVSLIGDVITALTANGVNLPAWVQDVLAAAQVLLPVILVVAGVSSHRRVASPLAIQHALVVLRRPPPAGLRRHRH